MRKQESGGHAAPEPEGVLVPEEILEQMGTITDEALRVILFLHLAEHRARMIGVSVALGELAEHCGLNRGRAKLALGALARQGVVEKVVTPCGWRLTLPEEADE